MLAWFVSRVLKANFLQWKKFCLVKDSTSSHLDGWPLLLSWSQLHMLHYVLLVISSRSSLSRWTPNAEVNLRGRLLPRWRSKRRKRLKSYCTEPTNRTTTLVKQPKATSQTRCEISLAASDKHRYNAVRMVLTCRCCAIPLQFIVWATIKADDSLVPTRLIHWKETKFRTAKFLVK